jgi:hypothetical protein
LSSRLRSRITSWAAAASFHRFGSSALAFSSSKRRRDFSQSKMPPQQGQRRADLVGHR